MEFLTLVSLNSEPEISQNPVQGNMSQFISKMANHQKPADRIGELEVVGYIKTKFTLVVW